MIYGLPFVLGEFGSAAGEVRAPAAGIDGAYRPMAAEYTWWTREFRVSHRGSEDAYAKEKRRQCWVWLGRKVVGGRIELKDRRKKGIERENGCVPEKMERRTTELVRRLCIVKDER